MSSSLSAAISIGFHGLAFAMVLYLISVGLSVTMGMMGFVNLAHGVFAMLGGYVLTSLMSRVGVPFVPALVCAFLPPRRQHRRRAPVVSAPLWWR
jgi:branched-chain amino acid transport system permease protein